MKYFVSFNLLVSALVLSTSLTLAQNHVIINTDMDGLHLSGDNSVLSLSGTHTASGITVDPGTTFTSLQINAGSADLTNVFTLKDSDLSGVKFIDSTNAWSALVGKVGASYHNAVVSNTKFTNASFEAYGSTWATCFTFYNAGFDNVDFAKASVPRLSIVTQPTDKIGREAANILIEKLETRENSVQAGEKKPEDRTTVTVTLKTGFVEGKSVRNLRQSGCTEA